MTATSSPALRLIKVTSADQERLLKLYSEKSREGHVRINLDMSPDIFEALSVGGFTYEVQAVEDVSSGELAAAGVRHLRKCYVNGEVQTVGYLSGLRVAGKYRKSRAMFMIFRKLRELYTEGECFGYLTSVFNSNITAKKVLTSAKAGMPCLKEIGQLNTCVFKPRFLKKQNHDDFKIDQASTKDIPDLVSFLQKEGAKYQFFPYLEEEDFRSQRGFLKNLEVSNIFLARKNGQIAGCMTFVDQTSFRRWKVESYSPLLKKTRRLLNIGMAVSGFPCFPPEQQSLRYHLLSLVCIENNKTEVFRALFNRAVGPLMRNDKSLLSVSLFEGSPYIAELPEVKLSFKSTIFMGFWDETRKQVETLDNRFPHLEAASL